ncbi:MAG TPA: hypothetical protein VIV15_10735, partial [Anaerolineales bacterium]
MTDRLCRPAWLELLTPERWPVLGDPLESLDGLLSPLADSAWEQVRAGAQEAQAEELYTGAASEERLPLVRRRPPTADFDQSVISGEKQNLNGIPASARTPLGGAPSAYRTGEGQTALIQTSEDSKNAQAEVSDPQPVIPERPAVHLRPAIVGREFGHTGLLRRPLDLPGTRPESSATDNEKSRGALQVSTPVIPPNPLAERAAGRELADAFTGARLVSDPSRLAAVLQANLHQRDRPATVSPLPAAPDHDGGPMAGPGDVFFIHPVASDRPQSALPRHEEETADVLTPRVEPFDAAQLERMVDEQFTRWLEDIEL